MPQFTVRVLDNRRLGPADTAFGPADYRAILEAAEYPDIAEIPDEELRGMCLLVLQELKPADAAILVLTHHLSDHLSRGQIHNLAHELGDEKHWEHYPDMALHERIFHVSSLMWAAFPADYPTPDAVGLTVDVVPSNDAARAVLELGLDETLLVRLLGAGMPPNAMLRRLFDDQLAGAPFPEASSIVWIWSTAPEGDGLRVALTGPNGWLGPLKRGDSWDSDARPDPAEVDQT